LYVAFASEKNRGPRDFFRSIFGIIGDITRNAQSEVLQEKELGTDLDEYDFLKSKCKGCNIITDYISLGSNLSYDNMSQMSTKLMNDFTEGNYDKIYVVYSQFKNAAVQFPKAVQFLPVKKLVGSKTAATKSDYIFEPSKEKLLEELIPSILQTSFHKYVLDTNAGEHGARMTAMDKATENANDLLRDLKIAYNKARQESITNEILEIVGGAAALEG
jgi:F-type H+-transporting ATPase subunit gamma